jgi:ribosomal-protein-alanine N-acetyltransferase
MLYRLWSDPQVTEFLDISPLTSEERAWKIVQLLREREKNGEGIRLGLFLKETGRLIGTCGFNALHKRRANYGEIGYDLTPASWGHGYMTEALAALQDYGFQKLQLHRIEALVLPQNMRSIRLLKRLGYQQEGLLRERGYWNDQYYNLLMFYLIRQ